MRRSSRSSESAVAKRERWSGGLGDRTTGPAPWRIDRRTNVPLPRR